MNKRLKKAGITVLALSTLSVGTAFANQDAAGKLQTWYDGRFGESTKEIKTELVSYAKSLVPGLEEEADELVNMTNQRIAEAAEKEKNRTNGRIHYYNGQYLGQIWEKKGELTGVDGKEGTVTQDFNQFVEDKTAEMNGYIDNHANQFIEDVTNDLDAEVAKTKKSITGIKDAASDDLKQEILNTKAEIYAKTAVEEEQAINELKNNFDEYVSEKKEDLRSAAGEAEQAQKEAITTKGQEIEDSANRSFDALINDINN